MAKLSAAEQAVLDKLQAKMEAPDAPPVGRSIQASVNLGDPEQVKLAIKHGFLTADEVEELKDEEKGDDEKGDDTPKRRGFFEKE